MNTPRGREIGFDSPRNKALLLIARNKGGYLLGADCSGDISMSRASCPICWGLVVQGIYQCMLRLVLFSVDVYDLQPTFLPSLSICSTNPSLCRLHTLFIFTDPYLIEVIQKPVYICVRYLVYRWQKREDLCQVFSWHQFGRKVAFVSGLYRR